MQKKLAGLFFTYRSYTPIPFLLLMLVFEHPNPVSFAIGLFMVILGESIRFWGVCWAGSETRTTGGVGGTFLVISGPFGLTRNPLYVGNILMYCGFGVMSYALFPYLLIGAFLFFALQYHLIVSEEEEYLRNTYKEQYAEYTKNVPRFFPRFTQYKNSALEQPEFEIAAGLRSERRTLQAATVVTLLIIVRWILL
jgi:protein-S-isoprenylcysteine O-methyltransferase Ste14